MEAAGALGAGSAGNFGLRDELYWHEVEQGGTFAYRNFRTSYPRLFAARDLSMSLIVNNGHPDYDGGVTPHTAAGLAAFGRMAARFATDFPAITAIEVGNEMNSDSFTSGPMREADLAGRAQIYTGLLAAVDAALSARDDLRVVGAAAHSVPLAWFKALSEAGAPALMDQVAVHPYNTPPEQFVRQISLLRQVPGFEALPLDVSEFGTQDVSAAPSFLLKYYCQGALAGASHMAWYPFNPRGDGFAPLVDGAGNLTPVGRVAERVARDWSGLPVVDISPDPFTYGCRFGDFAAVLWGAPRDVIPAPGVRVTDTAGQAVTRLDREEVVIVTSHAPLELGTSVSLGAHGVIADSYDQFAYPGQAGDGFTRFARMGEEMIPFTLGPGQERGGVPWVPYLRSERDGILRMNAEFLMPSFGPRGGVEIVHRFEAPRDLELAVEVMLEPDAASTDGVELRLEVEGRSLGVKPVTARMVDVIGPVRLAAGETLDIIVGPGGSPEGDASLYRFTLREAVD